MASKKRNRWLVGLVVEILGDDGFPAMIRLLDTPKIRELERRVMDDQVIDRLAPEDYALIYPTSATINSVTVYMNPGGNH